MTQADYKNIEGDEFDQVTDQDFIGICDNEDEMRKTSSGLMENFSSFHNSKMLLTKFIVMGN